MVKRFDQDDCSFCGRPAKGSIRLIEGPNCIICSECIKLCVKILTEQGIDFDEVVEREKLDIIRELDVKPKFRKIKFKIIKGRCFYLCPFSEPFNSIYTDHVTPIIKDIRLTIKRADEIYGTQPIIEDIWQGICESEIIIADVTGRNPNVMYEIGIAHTIGKPVLILTQSIDDIPFDLKHYRCILYRYLPKDIREFEHRLKETLQFVHNNASSSKVEI